MVRSARCRSICRCQLRLPHPVFIFIQFRFCGALAKPAPRCLALAAAACCLSARIQWWWRSPETPHINMPPWVFCMSWCADWEFRGVAQGCRLWRGVSEAITACAAAMSSCHVTHKMHVHTHVMPSHTHTYTSTLFDLHTLAHDVFHLMTCSTDADVPLGPCQSSVGYRAAGLD